MPRVSYESNPKIAVVLDMLAEMSRAETSVDSFLAFMTRFWQVRSIDLFVGVTVQDLPPGDYRVVYQIKSAELAAGDRRRLDEAAMAPSAELPIRRGGLIGEIVTEQRPLLLHHLALEHDPALGSDAAEVRACMALPIYEQGRIVEWALGFSVDPEGFTPEVLEEALLTANLLGLVQRHLWSLGQIRQLNQRLTSQFEEVARVQQQLLPVRHPPIPGVVLSTSYLPSDVAGGDYYDFFELADGRWGLLVADASGHGVGAATVMAMLHAFLHSYPALERGPASVLGWVNRRLAAARMDGSFVTALFAIYDPRTRELVYARAGHPLPRLKPAGRGSAVIELNGSAGLPLGIAPEYHVEESRVVLEPGHTLVLFTDGITEAFSPRREMFGTGGLDEALEACTGEPDCVVDTVHNALYQHTGRRTRDDDQTLVALKVVH
ncbi:MAG TPA: PP2C family protein-serine/threonine phosphatase [Phycisphaerales bacterium]|nr:PP2C family protein-serine/threonine phosphatase [Phycisphaerales bacterium]